MPAGREPGESVDKAERVAADAGTLKTAWERTLAEMEAMADDYREQGWSVVAVGAGDTTPEPPDVGPEDRFGLVAVVGDGDAGRVAEILESGGFPEYDVFRRTVDRRVFFVLVLSDPDTQRALFVAGQYPLSDAAGAAAAAREAGESYTYLQRLDGSVVAAFRHEAPEKFFPENLGGHV